MLLVFYDSGSIGYGRYPAQNSIDVKCLLPFQSDSFASIIAIEHCSAFPAPLTGKISIAVQNRDME